jgi:hypothetical protein
MRSDAGHAESVPPRPPIGHFTAPLDSTALQLPGEIGPGGERGRAEELPSPGQVPAPERLCAQEHMYGDPRS